MAGKRSWVLIVVAGLFTAAVLAAIGYLMSGWSAVIVFFVALAVISPLTVLLTRVVSRAQRQAMAEREPGGPLVRSGDLSLPISKDQVREAVLRAIARDRRAKILRSDDRRVLVQMGATWKSWGEFVLVEMDDEVSGTRLAVSSWPVLRTTLIDYGKNSANVRWLLTAVPAIKPR